LRDHNGRVVMAECLHITEALTLSWCIQSGDSLNGARGWLRHCATNRKVVGLIPDDVIGIFH
jgi:hypothetical protein